MSVMREKHALVFFRVGWGGQTLIGATWPVPLEDTTFPLTTFKFAYIYMPDHTAVLALTKLIMYNYDQNGRDNAISRKTDGVLLGCIEFVVTLRTNVD